MQAIEKKRMPWSRRVFLWLTGPRTLTFTPLQVAPIVATLLALIILIPLVAKIERNPVEAPTIRPLGTIPVVFIFQERARSVAVVGSFNGWQPKN